MSDFKTYAKKAVFYSKENPDLLVGILSLFSNPENLAEDVVADKVEVENGTEFDSAVTLLPTKLSSNVGKDSIPFDFTVTWGSTTTPAYSATDAGDYVLEGTIGELPSYVTNTDNKVVKVTITVAEVAEEGTGE